MRAQTPAWTLAAAASPTIEAGLVAAAELKAATAKISPLRATAEDSWAGSDDVLGAAKPTPLKQRRGPDGDKPTELTRTVPQAVLATAAAVSKAIATRYPQAFFDATRGAAGALGATGAAGAASAAAADQRPAAGRAAGAGGRSIWKAAPPGMTAESRLVVDLPASEFSYIERPWSHFVTRWAAIDVELEAAYGDSAFSLLDLGSCCGFFSLQVASGYPQSTVLGIEGSVGVGNGTIGVDGTEDEIVQTKAIQTHLRWIDKLYLSNCLLSPEVWDYRRVCSLAALGRPVVDVLLSLSVIHHIDNISHHQYEEDGITKVQGTVQLVAKLLHLAPRHFIELPDRPWIDHVHNAYTSHRAFLEDAARASGKRWNFVGPLCISAWYGTRELWMMEEVGARRGAPVPPQALRALFPKILGMSQQHLQPQQPDRDPAQALAALLPQQRRPPAPVMAPAPAGLAALAAPRNAPVGGPGVGGVSFRPPRRVGDGGYDSMGSSAMLPGGLADRAVAPLPLLPLTLEDLGAALLAAPTALIAAHVQLRDAKCVAEILLRDAPAPREPAQREPQLAA